MVALLIPATADASWYMRYGQAKNASKEYAKESCADLDECIGWGVGQCYRRAAARFSCIVGFWFPGIEPGSEIECQQTLHWGVRGGYVALKNYGEPHCV